MSNIYHIDPIVEQRLTEQSVLSYKFIAHRNVTDQLHQNKLISNHHYEMIGCNFMKIVSF